MISQAMQECLDGKTGSCMRPLIWYSGESTEKLLEEIEAVHSIGIQEFILENRGGNWFGNDDWWALLKAALERSRQLDMRMWLLDDSHVNTGSANDTLSKPENEKFRPVCLRVEIVDCVGPLTGGALMFPMHSEKEKILSISAFRRDEKTGHCYGEPVVLTGEWEDDLCFPELPAGLWRIFFVLTADPSRQGMFANYISMVSRESCRHLIDEVHEKVYQHLAPYFGNAFAGFFSDEPAFGNCDGQYGYDSCEHRMGQLRRLYPWWNDFPERLAEKTGLSIAQVWAKLPALWSQVDQASDLFRVAYMDIITGLWRENFSLQIGDWCHAHNVEYIGHTLEDRGAHLHTGWGCGHFFRAMAGQDMAGIDIVLNQIVPGYRTIPHASNSSSREYDSVFYHYTLGKLASSLAHQNPRMRNRAVCEMFGAYGWTCSLPVMRSIFNHFLASGVNQFMPHAFSMHLPGKIRQDAGEGVKAMPGFCMTHMPPTYYFGGLNPQYRQFGSLAQYVQRVAHLISSGKHLPDVAVFYAAEADWSGLEVQNMDEVAMALARSGIDFDFVPSDALYNDAAVAEGKLIVNQEKYGALIVSRAETLPQKLLDCLRALAQAGLSVIFSDSFPERSEARQATSNQFTGMRSLPLVEIPAYLRALPGTCHLQIENEAVRSSMRYYGVEQPDGTVTYLFYNDGIEPVESNVSLPGFFSGVLYDPWENKAYCPQCGARGIRVKFQPQQLLVLSLQKENLQADLPAFSYEEPAFVDLPLHFDIYMREMTESDFRLLRKDSAPVNLLREEKLTRTCAEFRYEATFQREDATAKWLQIPHAGDCAELWLNGESCGLALGPVCRFFIAGKLQKGENRLVILTADNPAYFDRQQGETYLYGTKLPLAMHGFVGNIQLGG